MSKKDNSSLSFIVPLSTITAESDKTDTVSIRVTVSGDYSCTQTFSRSCSDPEAAQMINTISLDGIPIGSSVTVSLEIFRDSTLLYQGTSDPFVVQPIENAVTLPLSAVTTP